MCFAPVAEILWRRKRLGSIVKSKTIIEMDRISPQDWQGGAPQKRHRVFFFIVLALLLLGGAWYFSIDPRQDHKKVSQAIQRYGTITVGDVDFLERSRELESALQGSSLPREREGTVKILLAGSLSEIDREKSFGILREVIESEDYPNTIKAQAINFLMDAIELDFIEPDLLRARVFQGKKLAELLSGASGDEKIAIRKLNEWAQELNPTAIASYRLAKWYAEELYAHPSLPLKEKGVLQQKIREFLNVGDDLFDQSGEATAITRRGQAFEMKARAIHMSGGDQKEAERYFTLAQEEYSRQPQTIFQIVYGAYTKIYYAAFLAREYGDSKALAVQLLLRQINNYLLTSQKSQNRNVRFVSFLTAARDSQENGYPAPDFDRDDIERIGALYPDFKATVDKLDLKEYVKGHPLENEIKAL